MKPIAYYSKSKDYVCTPEERTRLRRAKERERRNGNEGTESEAGSSQSDS